MEDMTQIARYLGQNGEILEGVVTGDEIEEISGLDAMLRGGRRVGGKRKLAEVQLLPWGLARKIVGIGKNYVDHAKELASEVPKEPLLLMKPTSGLIGHGQAIVLPPQSVSPRGDQRAGAAGGDRQALPAAAAVRRAEAGGGGAR